jgi:hypothetical protein
MRIEVGKEIEFAKLRLGDILYLIDNTQPVEGKSWKDYAEGLKELLRQQAQQAKAALEAYA